MSPERASAIKQMEDAIAAMRATEPASDGEEPELMTAWVAVAAYTRYSEDGGSTAVSVYMPDTMPMWQQIGLLQSGKIMVETEFAGVDTEET